MRVWATVHVSGSNEAFGFQGSGSGSNEAFVSGSNEAFGFQGSGSWSSVYVPRRGATSCERLSGASTIRRIPVAD